MRPPPFIKLVDDYWWVLAEDNAITLEAEKAKTIKWDKEPFQKILAALHRRPRGQVLDAGAFIGDSTRWFIDAGFPTLAFEVQRDAFLCLLRNCPESINFNFPVGNGERVFVDSHPAGNLGARSVIGTTRLETAGIPTLRLDDLDLQSNVALIKLDVEGWEPNVLEGARKLIEAQKPLVVVEVNPKALEAAGFTQDDILKHFKGWKQEEVFRYYDENWDILFTPPA